MSLTLKRWPEFILKSIKAKMIPWNILALILSYAQNLLADVNMKDAAFLKTWTDFTNARDRRTFNSVSSKSDNGDGVKINRTYRSRSLYKGFFGFGWCSDFEKSLTKNNSTELSLNDCYLNQPRHYVQNIKTQKYFSTNKKDYIELKNDNYLHIQNGRITQIFNLNGQLIQLLNNSLNTRIELKYTDKGALTTIESSKKNAVLANNPLTVTFDNFGHIKTIGENLKYKYKNDDLINVEHHENEFSYSYHYDGLHNLVKVENNNQVIEKIRYNAALDQVTSITSNNNCESNFKYFKPQNDFNQQISIAQTKCRNQPIRSKVFEFLPLYLNNINNDNKE